MTDLEHSLREDLTTISTWWQTLLDLPRTTTATTAASYVASPPPVPINVLSLRRDATDLLAYWVVATYRQRRLHTVIDLTDIPAACQVLTIHAGWLATHTDAVDQIAHLATAITELVEQTQPRRVAVGECPDCAGRLIAVMRTSDALLPCEVRCNLNPAHTWTPSQWRGLGERINSRAMHYEQAATRLVAILAKS